MFDFDNYSVSIIVDRIKAITSTKELEKIGISQQVISNWKSRNTFPKSDDLYKISQFLNVSMEYLLTGEDKENNLSQDETELLTNYRKLQEHDKSMLQVMVSAMASNQD